MDIREQLYIVKKQYIGLMAMHDNESLQIKISFQAMVNAVCFPTLLASANTRQAINKSLVLRQSYKQILVQLARYQSPALAAASSTEKVLQRSGKGFEIRVSLDPVHVEQAFVMLKLNQSNIIEKKSESNIEDKLDLHIALDEHFYHVHFSERHNNSFQIILATNSPEYLALVNADAHLYLIE